MKIKKFWYISSLHEISDSDFSRCKEIFDYLYTNFDFSNCKEIEFDYWCIVYDNNKIKKLNAFPIQCNSVGDTITINDDESSYWDFSHEKFCPIKINDNWGFINDELKIICNPKYDYVGFTVNNI